MFVIAALMVLGQLHPAHHHAPPPVHRAHCNFVIRVPGAPQPCLTRR